MDMITPTITPTITFQENSSTVAWDLLTYCEECYVINYKGGFMSDAKLNELWEKYYKNRKKKSKQVNLKAGRRKK